MADLFVLAINHKYGTNLYASYDYERLEDEVIKFAQEDWNENPPDWEDAPLPPDTIEEVDEYFGESTYLSYEIQNVEVLT